MSAGTQPNIQGHKLQPRPAGEDEAGKQQEEATIAKRRRTHKHKHKHRYKDNRGNYTGITTTLTAPGHIRGPTRGSPGTPEGTEHTGPTMEGGETQATAPTTEAQHTRVAPQAPQEPQATTA